MKHVTYFAVISLWIAGVTALPGQTGPLRVEREKVLVSYGDVVKTDIPLFPFLRTEGKVFRQAISAGGRAVFRLHFRVNVLATGPTWSIRLVDESGDELWASPASAATASDFWSPELPGAVTAVELNSQGVGAPPHIVIDRLAVRQGAIIIPQSPTYPDERELISTQSDEIRRIGRSVVRLRFVAGGGAYYCSGFLITSDLLMTNNHCIDMQQVATSALADFDLDAPGAQPSIVVPVQKLEVTDFALDYSILRLGARMVDRDPLKLVHAKSRDRQLLLLIEHAGGGPKEVSRKGCLVSQSDLEGRAGRGKTDFGHQCDTLGGSSGSPVLDLGTLKTVGLHHLGFQSGDAILANQAVNFQFILDHVQAARPDIYAQLAME